jgi:hypothetical protein
MTYQARFKESRRSATTQQDPSYIPGGFGQRSGTEATPNRRSRRSSVREATNPWVYTRGHFGRGIT